MEQANKPSSLEAGDLKKANSGDSDEGTTSEEESSDGNGVFDGKEPEDNEWLKLGKKSH